MKILVVEDNFVLAREIKDALDQANFQAEFVDDAGKIMAYWQHVQPDLLLLDLDVPHLDAPAICHYLSTYSKIFILVLNSCNNPAATDVCLNAGAHDFLVKPFSPYQLLLRVRTRVYSAPTLTPRLLTVADLTLDRAFHKFYRSGQLLGTLTPLEARLLEILMINAGDVLTRDQLIHHLWGPERGDRLLLK